MAEILSRAASSPQVACPSREFDPSRRDSSRVGRGALDRTGLAMRSRGMCLAYRMLFTPVSRASARELTPNPLCHGLQPVSSRGSITDSSPFGQPFLYGLQPVSSLGSTTDSSPFGQPFLHGLQPVSLTDP